MVAPVTNEVGTKAIYFPACDWYAVQSGEKISGPQTLTRAYALDEIPFFVRGGRILPMEQYAPRVSDLDPNRLSLTIWGGGHDTLRIYDDDGVSPDYQHGKMLDNPDLTKLAVHRENLIDRELTLPTISSVIRAIPMVIRFAGGTWNTMTVQ